MKTYTEPEMLALVMNAVQDEREACAEIADEWTNWDPDDLNVAAETAHRIRARRGHPSA